jgi:hypothetical protein
MLTRILLDITVELVNQDDCFLIDVFHLTLVVTSEDQAIDGANLLSRNSMAGVWDADSMVSL